MNKLTSIRIKYNDGTYLDQIPIGVLAQNVGYDSSHNLLQVLGTIDVDSNGTIQAQINKLFNEKVNSSDLDGYINNQISTNVTQWLAANVTPTGSAVMVDQSLSIQGSAADSKAVGDKIIDLKENLTYNFETLNTEDGFSSYPITQNMILNSDGSVRSTNAFITTDFIPIKNGRYKAIKKNFNGGFTTLRCMYDSQKKFIQYNSYVQDTPEREYAPDANVSFVRLSVSKATYESGISFKPIKNLKDDVNTIRRNVYGNLCGNDPNKFYPISLKKGDYLTISTADGSTPTYIELELYDETKTKINAYSISAAKRTIQIAEETYAGAKFIKFSKTPSVPIMVEFGIMATEYKEYSNNIFNITSLKEETTQIGTDITSLKEETTQIGTDIYGNLCGDNPNEFYPIVLNEGDDITLSTSTGVAPSKYIELVFFDENYYRIGAYSLNAEKRVIRIDSTYAAAKYIKWSRKPEAPLQVEFGTTNTEYKEYRANIFQCEPLLNESKNVYTYGPLPIVAVMTYNVGEWYNGTRKEMPESEYSLYENIQKTILKKNYASIFCAQEYYHTMYTRSLDAKNMFLYPLYKHVATLDDVALSRGKAIATNLWVESVESVDFVNQSGIASKYQKAYLFINGHRVCICNVHLSNIDTQQALLEAQEVATAMADEEYFIVMGDFNVSFTSATGADIISAFEAIGATPCNCGSFGEFDTYRGSAAINTTDSPIDNIFVSSNITIKSVYMDTTKIDAGLSIQDHVPLVAYLEIF